MVPIRRVVTVHPVKGMWTFDPAQNVPDGASPDMLNFQLYNGYLRKRPGATRFQTGSTFPAGPLTGVYSAQQTAGTRALYATNKVGLFKYNSGTTNWDAQTGPALTGGATDLFTFDVSQNNLVFSQGVDNIMALPLTGTVYAVINANAKPSRYLTRWNQRLFCGFTVEGGANAPFRVRWPVAADHTNWIGVGAGFVDLTDDVYQVRNIKKLIDVLCVYTEKGIFLGTKTGVASGPVQFALQVKEVGLASPLTLQVFNVLHFLLGTDNLYAFDGVKLTSLADAVRGTMFASLSANQMLTNFGLLLYDSQEYAAFVATGSNTAADTAWLYNWARQCVYPWKFASGIYTCATLHYLDSSVTIASLTGTIAAQTWVIGSFSLSANFPLPILGASDGRAYLLASGVLADDGVAFTCRWTSKDYSAQDIDPSLQNDMITMKDVGFEYVDPGTAFTLQFYFSIDRGTSWSGPFPVTVGGGAVGSTGDAMCTRQTTGKRVRFKIENTTTNEMPQIQSFSPTLEGRKEKVA